MRGLGIFISLATLVAAVQTGLPGGEVGVDEALSLLAEGKQQLRSGSWADAKATFGTIAERYPHFQYTDQVIFHRAKASYHLGDFADAIADWHRLATGFPDSPTGPYALFYMGNAFYRRGEVTLAVKSYLDAYALGDDSGLCRLVEASLAAAFQSASDLQIGSADLIGIPQPRSCSLAVALAEVLIERGDTGRARELTAACEERNSAASLPGAVGGRRRNASAVALILPLSGQFQSFAQDICDGAAVAAELSRADGGPDLGLVLYDTKGDPVTAARIVSDLPDYFIVAAIGPLTSEEAAVASASLRCASLPLLVPAATQPGLTRLSSTCFQLSPNTELEAILMADYAWDHLQADSAAVITSNDVEHLRTASAFAERFRRLGGTIVAMEYYGPHDNDFGPYIRDIKKILLGTYGDSTFFINDRGDTLEPDGLPAHLDCLFLPGNPEQIRLLLPQIRFYGLDAAFLGTDAWADESILKLEDNVTRNAVFSSPFLTLGESGEYEKFAAAYDARYGRQPNRLAALGYDAVRLVFWAFRNGARTQSEVARALREIKRHAGASGMITFGQYRENIELPLFRIEAEQAVPLSASAPGAPESGQR